MALELLGRPLLSIHPAVPVPPGRGLSIGALSYGGELHVGLSADTGVVADVPRLGRDVAEALGALRDAASGAPTAWRARARARRDVPAPTLSRT